MRPAVDPRTLACSAARDITCSSVAPSNPTIINNQLRVAGDNVGRGLPFGHERHDRRNRDTRANDARHPAHDSVVHADPLELDFRS